ncbi:LIM and calponin homology domains-containing protein 1-like isoform X6 [Hippoglossus hippoglossus]|uniref:LIM and calponin homology domains-containing protein 1-like isoform X6 n=1 Tax=Hippoglossus hippoglossus TaxID=8267 RepID=UPI00148B78A2|nr:LIM and calponin homology domains-containing protein 1-like isoform X6 [Hippoglossus hippoglossus]
MASPAADIGQSHQHHPASDSAADSAFQEAQTWIEAVTGRCFGDRDFRGGLENGILLCELLSSIKPGLVKKINRLPTPIAGLDNLSVFLRGCEELGLKGSQLFDPGDLQDTSTRPIAKGSDCSRKLKNVLITIYWLGRAANGCTSYNGPTLDLKEFEGLLSQMRKEAEEAESPKRSIRDSGYIDCWDSERSDSLSPPRHGREDSFDSLDSFGSRSRQTPSPDVLVARGSSDGRGSDSESDGTPHRKVPDIRKDDMSARRTSVSELRTAMPFNQYLPNKSNQSGYVPTPLRKKKNDKEEGARKSWSTATSPIGGDRPFSPDEIRSLDTPSPSSPPPLEPQTQIHREDEGPRTVSIPSIEIHAANRRRSSDPPPCSVPQPHAEPHADTVTHLMGASAQSTPARSCSEELFHLSTTLAGNTVVASVVATGPGKHSPATDREEAGVSKGPAGAPLACQTLTSLKRTPSPSHLLPVPAATATTSKEIANTGRRKGRALSESDDPQGSWFDGNLPATFSHTDIVSDDSQSVSMIDMRGEDEGILQPHSQVRHELMHNQYNMMKEEEDHWQDDLARWKNRRRSVSQDLIKKEEERKMMENLLTGDVCPAQRRRSIKTYREIVEEKERREEDLRDTYRRARTPEEASVILQRYAQRFSISETILERLQLPQLLDRSISADPSFACSPFPLSLSSSPTTPDPFDVDPNGPLRFLRQQSAPAPKFTSTLEARIEEFPKDLSSPHQRPQIRSRSSEPPSTRALSPKPVPLLTPKPYFESRGRAAEPWANKADGLLRVNGNAGSDAPTAPESRGTESPPHFQASPSRTSHSTVAAPCSAASPAHSPHASPAGGSPASIKAKEARGGTRAASEDVREQRGAEHSSPLSRPTSLPAELQKSEESFWKTGDQTAAGPEEKTSNAAAQPTTRTEAKQEVKPEASGPNVATLVQSGLSTQQCHTVTLQASFPSSQEFSQGGENVPNLTAPGSSGYHPAQELTAEFANSVISPPATSNPKLRWEFFAPPEAPEKDLRGNEKYRREQEKLKEEWEKAQREVAEEERKYHEEERRILEETAAPLTPRSSALPSPSRGELSSTAEPHDTIVRSLADWERKQELLERQSRGSTESAEGKRRENDRTSDISTADDSMKTGRSLVSHSSSQPETLGHSLQNGQKPPATLKPSTPVKKQEDLTTDGNKAGQSAGDRRGGPIDNNTSRSSSKPPAACPPPPDTLPPAPNRSVSGKKLCSSCGQPLGKGAAMIIETLSLYFHIHCFKCGVCKGQLGDTTTGTDVRIRNGLLNCHQCYIRSRSAGQPTTL